MTILRHNSLDREDIRELFRADRPMQADTKVRITADQIMSLLLEERLSIMEGACVVQAVTGDLLGE